MAVPADMFGPGGAPRRGIGRMRSRAMPSAQFPARPDSGAVPGNTQRCRREHQET
jgi:hypothetical protein